MPFSSVEVLETEIVPLLSRPESSPSSSIVPVWASVSSVIRAEKKKLSNTTVLMSYIYFKFDFYKFKLEINSSL